MDPKLPPLFKIPPRVSEVQLLRAEVAALRRECAAMARQLARMPQPARESWERHSAPELVLVETPIADEQPSAFLQLLSSSSQA